jgi:Flp pilus assembly protein protease CpaA
MLTALWNVPAPACQWSVAIAASFIAAAWDAQTHRIPNWLTGALFLTGVAAAARQGGMAAVGDGLAGCCLAAAPFFLLFVFAGGGAADAKLMGALGMWLGARNGVALLLAVTIAGAVLGICYSLMRGSIRRVTANLLTLAGASFALVTGQVSPQDVSGSLPSPKAMQPMPYGLSIFTGTCLAAGAVWMWKTGRMI